MIQTIRNAWKVQELRNKILFTIFALLIFRVGCAIPVPFIDGNTLSELYAAAVGYYFRPAERDERRRVLPGDSCLPCPSSPISTPPSSSSC